MATWKKVIVSGSVADLANLSVDGLSSGQVVLGGGSGSLLTTRAINGTGNIVATTGASGLVHSGSFSGSFFGDGSGLTGLATLFRYAGSTGAYGESNLIANGVMFTTSSNQGFSFTTGSDVTIGATVYQAVQLTAPQDLRTTADVTFNSVTLPNGPVLNSTAGGELIVDAANGTAFSGPISSSLIPHADNTWNLGTTSARWQTVYGRFGDFATHVRTPYVSSSAGFQLTSQTGQTYTANTGNISITATAGTVSVEGTVFNGDNVTIPGNLYVQGTQTNLNTTNLDIEDAFILLRSGSAVVGDSGIIFGGSTGFEQAGTALFWDASYNFNDGRLAIKDSAASTVTGSLTPDYYVAGVVVGNEAAAEAAQADHPGNIRVDVTSGEIFIYV